MKASTRLVSGFLLILANGSLMVATDSASRAGRRSLLDDTITLRPVPLPVYMPTLQAVEIPIPTPTLGAQLPTPMPVQKLPTTPEPTDEPTPAPSPSPTHLPTQAPSPEPSPIPSLFPTRTPTRSPTMIPSPIPTHVRDEPSPSPTRAPTKKPSPHPTHFPVIVEKTSKPTVVPIDEPSDGSSVESDSAGFTGAQVGLIVLGVLTGVGLCWLGKKYIVSNEKFIKTLQKLFQMKVSSTDKGDGPRVPGRSGKASNRRSRASSNESRPSKASGRPSKDSRSSNMTKDSRGSKASRGSSSVKSEKSRRRSESGSPKPKSKSRGPDLV